MTTETASSLTSDTSKMVKLKRDKFALLAKVGHLGREVSALHDEADHYSSIATELLAVSSELLTLLEEQEEENQKTNPYLVIPASRLTSLTQKLLNYWPKGSKSQDRVYEMLDSDGVVTVTDTSEEGFVYPSMDLILKNVGRAIGASREQSPRRSSSFETLTKLQVAGTSGNESLRLSLL